MHKAMRLDVHTHAFHHKIAHKVLEQLSGHYGISPVGDGTLADLMARVERAGLDGCVVHNAATTPDQVVPANAWALSIQRDEPRATAFGTLHPGYGPWEAQLDLLERGGVRGIKLHPDFQGFRLDDPRLNPMFEAMAGRFAVMVHVGDRLPPERNPSCPFKLMRVHADHPRLTLIAAHMGGYLHWKWALECLVGSRVYIDTSSSVPFMDPADLAAILRRHPRERVLFGSDYPLFDPGQEIAALQRAAGLTDAALEELLGNGAFLARGGPAQAGAGNP